jgi:elongation factor P
MISTKDFKNGKVIKINGGLYYIVRFQHIKPGKGGAFVRTKLKNLKSGAAIDKTFRPEEAFEEAFIDQKKLQYLYRAGDACHFMNTKTYEQIELSKDALGDCAKYLKDNIEVTATVYNNKIIGIEPPLFVTLTVTETEPGIKGNTAKAATKPATLETGLTVQVPLFVNKGELVKVDTRTGEYVERA